MRSLNLVVICLDRGVHFNKREVILLDGVKQPRIRLVSKRRSIAIGALNPVGIRL